MKTPKRTLERIIAPSLTLATMLLLGVAPVARGQALQTNNQNDAVDKQIPAYKEALQQANERIRQANETIRKQNEEMRDLAAKVAKLTFELSALKQAAGSWQEFVPDKNGSYPAPPYPKAAMEQRLSGSVSVQIVVATNGLPSEISIQKSSGESILDSNTVNWVKNKWRWPDGPVRRLR